ncbi:MAG: 30S ribosomal protein S4 [Candidatus Bathyarchaeia archaeon]
MGDPKRNRKKYETPRVPWSLQTLESELRLLGEYGLRNKRELWRHKTKVSRYRKLARSLLGKSAEERAKAEKTLLYKLRREGLVSEGATLDDVLDLTVNDILERRLQTLVFRKGFAKTIQQARQLITHGHIAIGPKIVRVPSYHVTVEEEGIIGYAPSSPLAKEDHPLRVSIEAIQSSQKIKEAEAEF